MAENIYVALVDEDGMGRERVVYAGPREDDARDSLLDKTRGNPGDRIERWCNGVRVQQNVRRG